MLRLLTKIAGYLAGILMTQRSIPGKLDRIIDLLEQLVDSLAPGPAVKLIFSATLEGITQEGITMIQITDAQKVSLSIQPVDAKGNPAPVDGAPVWNSSDPTIITLEVAADGLSAVATAVGPLTAAGSSVQVSVAADADLGTGVATINGTLDVTVVASQATSLTINAAAPEAQ